MKNCLIAIGIVLLCFSCKLFDDDSSEDDRPGNENPALNETVTMERGIASGWVRDPEGNPVSGVMVTTGDESVVTDVSGVFYFDRVGVVNTRSVFKFTREGYFQVVRSNFKEDEISMEVTIHPKGNSEISCEATFSSSYDKQLNAGGMTVDLQAQGIVVESTGKPYSGTVKADVLYMSPDNEDFAGMMPGGDLAAIRTDQSETTLFSYGMVNVNLTSEDGKALQLKEGKASTLTFPIPSGMEQNPPQTIPLWHFNEKAGIWTESGVAALVGDKYVGEVSHFSVVNADVPFNKRICLTLKFIDCNRKPVPSLWVNVEQTRIRTNQNGMITVYVDEKPTRVRILSKDYGNYKGAGEYAFSSEIPGVVGRTESLEVIELPCLNRVSGVVENSCGDNRVAAVWLEYPDGREAAARQLSVADGSFSLPVPVGYSGPMKLRVQARDTVVDKSVVVSGNVDAGEISLCNGDPTSGGTIIISCPGPTFESITCKYSPYSDTEGILIFGDKLGINSDRMYLFVDSYSRNQSRYSDVLCAFLTERQEGEFAGWADVEITFIREDFVRIEILDGHGSYDDYLNDRTYEIDKVSGTFFLPVIGRGLMTENVFSLAGIDIPDFVQLSVPVDLLIPYSSSVLMERGVEAYYKNKGTADCDKLRKAIESAGFVLLEGEDSSYDKWFVFRSKNNLIVLEYFVSGLETWWSGYGWEDRPSTDYTMSVTLYENCRTDFIDRFQLTRSVGGGLPGGLNPALRKDILKRH